MANVYRIQAYDLILLGNNGTKDVAIVLPLKYLSNFWRNLETPQINCEITLDLITRGLKNALR